MQTRLMRYGVLAILALSLPQRVVRADIAPPRTPPGTTLLPGKESTKVRMLAETVTLAVTADPANADGAIARTEALFTMRNLGTSEERMQVRFPLSFFDGSSDGRFDFPEIPSIAVNVDGKAVPTRREMQPPFNESGAYREREELPWAVFDVIFPPSANVTVGVTYIAKSYGYYPQATFDYILETGSGWNGTIGSADVVVHLPYEASERNTLVGESSMTNTSTPGGVFNGNEIRWHYAEFEPTRDNNIEVILIAPSVWESVVKETETVTRNPREGESWGRLAKAYKEAARLPKGWLRDDTAGREMLELSRAAYEKCLALLPEDPLWHYGYADLLWSEYYWEIHSARKEDSNGLLPKALTELQTTLALDPGNGLARDMLEWIRTDVPGAVQLDGDSYIFLGLTATPMPPTPYGGLPPGTLPAAPTYTAMPPPPANVPTQSASPAPVSRNPVCGGLGITLAVPFSMLILRLRRRVAS